MPQHLANIQGAPAKSQGIASGFPVAPQPTLASFPVIC
jgi:hypothetical protein